MQKQVKIVTRKGRPDIAAKIRHCSELLIKRNAKAYRKLATR